MVNADNAVLMVNYIEKFDKLPFYLAYKKAMNEQQRKQYELIRERRFQAANEARQIAHELGLDESEAEWFISDAVSNAIWDAQQMRPYRVPEYKPAPSSSGPLYKELTALGTKK